MLRRNETGEWGVWADEFRSDWNGERCQQSRQQEEY